MEQSAWDAAIQMLAGILFLTPLKAMFKRVLTNFKNSDKQDSFFEYHFPYLSSKLHRNK